MGLDMYLSKKTYVGNKYRSEDKQVKVVVPENQEGVTFPTGKIKSEKISSIIEEVGYWRKANQIHNWFVQNVQEGEDDCKEYYVSEDQLKELLSICKKIKQDCALVEGDVKNGETLQGGKWVPILQKGYQMTNPEVAEELLPSSSGFFFGSTDYDQWYMQDIDNTLEIIESLMDEEGDIDGDIYYSSSW